jgi:hypothetical protein
VGGLKATNDYSKAHKIVRLSLDEYPSSMWVAPFALLLGLLKFWGIEELLPHVQVFNDRLAREGNNLDGVSFPIGGRDYVLTGAALAVRLQAALDSNQIDLKEAQSQLLIALERLSSGDWEATRYLWPERTRGLLLIGLILYELTHQDRIWSERFLESYFDIARLNGRHACWLHLLAAAPTLELLNPGSLSEVWDLIEPIEDWHKYGDGLGLPTLSVTTSL